MKVNKIALNGFRNYEWDTAEFSGGTNVISGRNAQGKTNLLEAVYMLSCGRSFRTRFDRELTGFGYSAAEILAEVTSHDRDQTIRIIMQPGTAKKITVNGVRKSAAELSEVINAVLFCPDDLNLIKEGAAVRRRLLDNAISQIRPRYAELLSDFNKLYENKSRILKDWHEKPSLLDALDEFSDAMCRASAQLIRYRAAFAARLDEAARPIHSEFSGSGEKLEIKYKTVSTVKNVYGSAKEIYYDICEHQEAHRRAELDSGQCLTGAHKDDLEIFINGRPARSFASQGQTRTAALSMKLAERRYSSPRPANIRYSCWTMCFRSLTRSGRNLSSTASAAGRRSSPAARTRRYRAAPEARCCSLKTGEFTDVSASRQGHGY